MKVSFTSLSGIRYLGVLRGFDTDQEILAFGGVEVEGDKTGKSEENSKQKLEVVTYQPFLEVKTGPIEHELLLVKKSQIVEIALLDEDGGASSCEDEPAKEEDPEEEHEESLLGNVNLPAFVTSSSKDSVPDINENSESQIVDIAKNVVPEIDEVDKEDEELQKEEEEEEEEEQKTFAEVVKVPVTFAEDNKIYGCTRDGDDDEDVIVRIPLAMAKQDIK